MDTPPVTLERFAQLRAEMESGALRDDVLRRESLDPDAWTAAQKAWLAKMGEELGRGRFELTNRYGAAFVAGLAAAARAPSAKEPDAAEPTALAGTDGDETLPLVKSPLRAAPGLAGGSCEIVPPFPPPNRAAITMDLPLVIDVEEPLPFVKGAPGERLIFPRETSATPEPPSDSKPPSTLPMDEGAGRMRAALWQEPVLPFQSTAGVPQLTMEQYASLTVDILLDPARTQETLRRYQLTTAQKSLVDAAWKARLAASPAARIGFDAACAAYHVWKLQNKG